MAVYTTINDPSLYFNTVLWTGNDTTATAITGVGFQPDMTWIKERSEVRSHVLFDVIRGATVQLNPNDTATDATVAESLQSFDADGFTVGDATSVNKSGETYVGWNWKANGAGSANTDGSINTTATSANTTAGFSINQWDGSDADGTLGHGLGVAPRFIIIKNQDSAESWYVYHESMGNGNKMSLSDTSAASSAADWWQDTSPTDTLIYLSGVDGINGNNDMINYCWHDVQGFSKFGSYIGNGSADGPFIYTGFRPAYVMYKTVDQVDNWEVHDNKRDTVNPMDTVLYPNATNAESDPASTTDRLDFLSNGFKMRTASSDYNGSGNDYIYAAFAEAPFVNSEGVPCNAK
jgi:hypothetical protein